MAHGQVGRAPVTRPVQTEHPHHVFGHARAPRLFAVPPGQAQDVGHDVELALRGLRRHHQVVEDAHASEQLELLERAAHTEARARRRPHGCDVSPVEHDAPTRGRDEPADRVEDRRLARAVGTDQADETAFGNLNRRVVHGRKAAEADRHPLREQRAHSWPPATGTGSAPPGDRRARRSYNRVMAAPARRSSPNIPSGF